MRKLIISAVIFAVILMSFVLAFPRNEPSLTQAEKTAILENLKYSDKVSREVISQLEDKDKIRAIISLDDSNMYKLKKLEKIRPKIKENQNNVLKEVPGLKVIYQYNNINSMAVEIDAKYLAKLEASSFVKSISEEEELQLFLDKSSPQIGANEVWNTLGYTGEGQNICVIDTGINYTHPAIGSQTCRLNQQEDILSPSVESPHYPYLINYNNTWVITRPGFSNIAVYINISVEEGYDFVYILNKQGIVIQEFSMWEIGPAWSAIAPGDTIKINLVSNGDEYADYEWGFNATKVKNVSWTGDCGDFAGGYDFVNHDADPIDDNGHGTHVAGIITSDDLTYKGVANDTKIFAVKSCGGSCSSTNVIAGVDYCLSLKDNYKVNIISMSLGGNTKYTSYCNDPIADAVNVAYNAGMFVSVASGNQNWTDGISSPACASGATSVGAVNKSDLIWQTGSNPPDFAGTNRGSLLDLLAPGQSIKSTNLTTSLFAIMTGTSMAAPHVAGLAALMLQANSSLTPWQIEHFMNATGKLIYDSASGLYYPRINASAAVRAVIPQQSEIIDITLEFGSINFNNLNPGTANQSSSGYHIISNSNVNVDLYHKGTNFSTGGNDIPIENMRWFNDSILSKSFIMKEGFDKNITNINPGANVTINYWLSIPAGQTAGTNYQSSITIKAVKTGSSP